MATGTRTTCPTPTTNGRCVRGVPEHSGPPFDFGSVHRAWLDCRRGKGNSPSRWRFEADLERNLIRLVDELQSRRYQPSPSVCFATDQPKRREIFAAAFRDRVVHHLLVRQLEPYWERRFIHDSYACRRGKGTLAAVNRVQQFIRQATGNGSARAWFLHLDIRSFFVNIDKAVLLAILESGLERQRHPWANDLQWLSRCIVSRDPCLDAHRIGAELNAVPAHKSLYGTGNVRGLPIGNYSSQFFANVYLDRLDQFVKHDLRHKYYLRYVDDLVLLDRDPERLLERENAIATFLQRELRLALNPGARVLAPTSNGIDILGYMIHREHRLLRRRTVRRFEQRLRKSGALMVKPQGDRMVVRYPPQDVERLLAMCMSYRGLLHKGNSFHLMCRFSSVPTFIQKESTG
ncbi:MAG: group II intron reverse transcriptase domain-containing protein [Pseudomonadales bacterium]|nr:group II intron reverse transcriptase domain-containing protein [Pseudomonadales bacterium]